MGRTIRSGGNGEIPAIEVDVAGVARNINGKNSAVFTRSKRLVEWALDVPVEARGRSEVGNRDRGRDLAATGNPVMFDRGRDR